MKQTLLFFLLASVACSASRVIDRTDAGKPILLVGPQPDAESLQKTHRYYGVKTVLNLRGESAHKTWFKSEKRGVEAIGAEWVQLRMSGYLEPAPDDVNAFFDLVENRAKWPIFMHCQSGIHRTGLMTALYRRQYQGWSAEKAIEEMNRNGFQLGFKDRTVVLEAVRNFKPNPKRTIPR